MCITCAVVFRFKTFYQLNYEYPPLVFNVMNASLCVGLHPYTRNTEMFI